MGRWLIGVGLALLLLPPLCSIVSFFVVTPPPPTPTAEASDVSTLSAALDGVWDVQDPPIEVTIDLRVQRIVIAHKGLPIKQTWFLRAEREDKDMVFLRGPKMSGGGSVTVRFVMSPVNGALVQLPCSGRDVGNKLYF